MKTDEPNLVIIPTKDLICSCNVCGESNYTGGTFEGGRPIEKRAGIEMFDLRVSSNGYQTSVTRICLTCLGRLHDLSGIVYRGKKDAVSWSRS